MATFAERLRELRNEKRMTMKELADKLSLTEQAISMYERNERRPNFEKLEEIADLFNVDMNYLLGKSDIKNSYQQETDIYGINKQEMLAYLSKHNPELLDTYKHITDNENLSLLFDAAKDLTPEDLAPILAIIQNIRKAKGIE